MPAKLWQMTQRQHLSQNLYALMVQKKMPESSTARVTRSYRRIRDLPSVGQIMDTYDRMDILANNAEAINDPISQRCPARRSRG